MNEKRTILLIEDERALSNFICRALTANDYKAVSASSGQGRALPVLLPLS